MIEPQEPDSRKRNYTVWRRQMDSSSWIHTAYTITAKTTKEAQAKLRRTFAGAGFTSMSLVAIAAGEDPNGAKHELTNRH